VVPPSELLGLPLIQRETVGMAEKLLGHTMSFQELEALYEALQEQDRRIEFGGHIQSYFPDEGPLSYKNYPKQMEFFKLGSIHRERLFMAANRSGKTIAGGYEATCHATGLYPHWWTGKRFDHPTDGWAAGDTGQTTRDILQNTLLGFPNGPVGTGLIPGDLIIQVRRRSGIADAVDTVKVKHVSGGESFIGFKSFDQGRRSFQGTGKEWIWLDEECPQDVYGECLIRTMTTGGVVYVTFTPLLGMTVFIQDFLKDAHKEAAEYV
jgi:phage terminase large subunit-like protein